MKMVDQVLIKRKELADLKSLLPLEQLIIQAERPYMILLLDLTQLVIT